MENKTDKLNGLTRIAGVTNEHTYTVDGKLQSVSIPGEGLATYHYDQRGLNDRITLPGGVARISEFDGFGQLKAQRVEDAAGNNLLLQSYQRSLTGSIQQKTTDSGVWNYGYDLTGQLTNALLSASGTATQEWGYRYDAMGNREQMSEVKGQGSEVTDYQPNSLNQYTSISNSMLSAPCPLLYDLNGNLTNDGVRAYTWDTQNGLIRVQDVEIVEGSIRVEFAYDFMGRRIRKDVSVYQGSGFTNQASHIFFYDGWNLVKEVSQSTNNASTNLYVWGNDLSQTLQGAGGVGGLLCSITQASGLQPQAFYPCYDHNGNVEKVLTRSGAVVAAFQYDAFGNTIKETLASGLTPQAFSHRFSTKYFDSETGLYYYGYRYYSPEKGRWINRDPIGERGGMNLYGFVLNNPGNAYDRLGLETACCGDKSYNDEKQCCKNNEIKDLYDVSIHSYSSMKSHSWISAYNLSTGVKHTYGTRRADHVNPNEFAGGPNSDTIRDGLYVDYGREMNPPSSGFTTRTKKVCDFKPDPDPGYYLIGNNCTTYACNTWESNTGENLDTGLDSPDSLYDAINMALLGLWGDFSV